MAETSFTDTLEEKLAFISPTVKAIEFGGDQSYLRELQTLLGQHLANLVVLFERDPGLDAATADLYAAAAAVVNDTTMASQPLARKRRLLKEAQARFHERISTARPNGRRACAAWRQNELFLAAWSKPGFRISQCCAAEPNPPISPKQPLIWVTTTNHR